MRNILIVVILLAVLGGGVYWAKSNKMGDAGRVMNSENIGAGDTDGKLKVATFHGRLQEVNTGCFADGECYVVVSGKHVTTTLGWSRETVGSIQGAESFGDLENHIGEEVEVYAQDIGNNTYTLYGSAGFYVKLLEEEEEGHVD